MPAASRVCQIRVVGQRISDAAHPGAPAGRLDSRYAPENGAFPVVQRGHVQAQRARIDDARHQSLDHRLDLPSRRHPRPHGRRAALPRECLQLVGQNPPALGHDPVGDVNGGEVGSYLGRRADRRDVEDLAAADSLVAAQLPQDVVIARQQRDRLGQVEAHEAGGPGRYG